MGGDHFARWHAGCIALHAADCWLVYLLCRRIGLARAGSVCACLVFLVNGCAAEPVAWIDGSFDLIATGFVLLALILTCRYFDLERRSYLVAALAVTSVAVLCKESAFCLRALVVCVALLRPEGTFGSRQRRAFVWVAVLCGVLFAYRWWAVGGLGGHGVRGTGFVDFVRYNLFERLDGLFLRQWAILFFP